MGTRPRAVQDGAALRRAVDVLSDDRRRRLALVTLQRNGGELSLPDLADEVAVLEYDRPLYEVDADDVMWLYLSLYHDHIPPLAEADIVAYDQESDYLMLTDFGMHLTIPEPRVD